MKRLNKKGFTLVELLAVIIILAIVVGITIPAVLTTVDSSRKKARSSAAEVVADWVDKQYQLISVGFVDEIDSTFSATDACGTNGELCTGDGKDITDTKFIQASGVKTANVSKINVKINKTTGRSCVTLTVVNTGDYYIQRDGGTQTVKGGGDC